MPAPEDSALKDVVERYVEGFRTNDREAVLATLHDDVIWTLHGYKTLVGKGKFEAEIDSPGSAGHPRLTVDRLVEDGNTVVVIGRGDVSLRDGGGSSFAFCDVYVFEDRLIKELESFQVNLNQVGTGG